MKQPLISVIIPVHNVENYLARCVDSVLAQTHPHLEILLIDDGSTDASGTLCDKYARQDKRIRVFHKPQGGVGSARNTGLEAATGEYIGFVDGDDYIAPTLYEQLLLALTQSQADISVCSVINVHPGEVKKQARTIYHAGHVYTHFNEWIHDFCRCGIYHVSYNKLFKKQVIGKTRFNTKLVRAEDVDFVFHVTQTDRTIVLIAPPLYYYIQRANSAMRQIKISYFESEYQTWKYIFDTLKKRKEDFSVCLKELYTKSLALKAAHLAVLIILWDDHKQYREPLARLRELFLDNATHASQISERFIRIFSKLFAKHPKLVTGLLRFPGVKQGLRYYIQKTKCRA